MTHEEIVSRFRGTGDFIVRELRCCGFDLYAYAVDGLVSGADMSDYVIKPIAIPATGAFIGTPAAIKLKQPAQIVA